MPSQDLAKFTVAELKAKLRKRKLATNGAKVELIARLMDADPSGNWINEQDDYDSDYMREEYFEEGAVGGAEEQQDRDRVVEEQQPTHDWLLKEVEFMRREKKLMERELALARRETEMLRNSPRYSNSSVSMKPNVNVKAIGELLREFNGVDSYFSEWEKQVRLLCRTYELDDNLAKILISSKLKGKAMQWFHSKSDYIEMNLNQLLQEMQIAFDHRPSKLERRRKFERRTWRLDETFNEYYYDKLILGNQVPIDEEDMLEHVIDGITDITLRNQARLQSFNSVTALLEAFKKISIQNNIKNGLKREAHLGEKSGEKLSNQSSSNNKFEKPPDNNTQQGRRIRCFNCNKLGHSSKICREPKKEKGTCFRCGEVGHFSKTCPNNMKETSEVNNIYRDALNEDEFRKIVTFEIKDSNLRRILCLDTLLDTGSAISIIKERFVNNEVIETIDNSIEHFCGINNSKLIIKGKIIVNIILNGVKRDNIVIYVVPENTMITSAILGRDTLRIFDLTLSNIGKSDPICEIMNIDTSQLETDPIDSLIINSKISIDVQQQFKKLFQETYIQLERPLEPKDKVELRLTLKDTQPFNCTPRRLSYVEKDQLKLILDRLLKKGTIRPSTSEYASPIVIVKKKNGEPRMCVDYRILNKVTARDNYPLPIIEDQLEALNNKKYFSTLDLKDGFHHVSVAEDSIKYTSFVTPVGQFEWLKMPFGLKTAPSTFQRFINNVFSDLIKTGDVLVYMDDILVATETIEYHLEILQQVFKLMVDNILSLRMDKCRFLQNEIEYLGYKISEKGISPTKSGVEAVLNFPIPKSTRELHSFLGLCSYFRKFIENYSIIAKPLYDILKVNTKFKFGIEELNVFECLKIKLVEAPILALYSPKDETELHCDASAIGFGAILMQKKADGIFHPVFYFSKRTTESESKFHSFELETLAIIYALKRFRVYLQGIKFKILTDCNSLTMTLKKKDVNPRIARWSLELLSYDYTLEHKSATRMRHVDALSRVVGVIEDNPFEWNLTICQSQDSKIAEIRNMLEQSEDKFFEMRNGLIYRKCGERLLFYVPEQMEKNVIFKYHDEMGHFSIEKTYHAIIQNYWFPKLKEKIDIHVKNCLKCISYSPITGKREGFLHLVPKGNIPFTVIHIDHLGPIDKQQLQRRYILVVIDAFTKYVKLYATKTTSSKESINCLTQYFQNYSRPQVIVSDRGTCFSSHEFQEFMKENHIKHIKIATGSPQANGQVERINRILTPLLGKLSHDSVGKTWHKLLANAEYAINNTVSKSTGETPSKLLFGVEQRGKSIDDLKEYLQNNKDEKRDSLDKVREKASVRIERLQKYNKEYRDKKSKPAHEYCEGDLVMLKNFENTPGVCKKLIPSFKGPYSIVKRLRNDRYIVADVEGFQNTQKPYRGVWQACNMKLWRQNSNLESENIT